MEYSREERQQSALDRLRVERARELNEYRYQLIRDSIPEAVFRHPRYGEITLRAESKFDAFRRAAEILGVGMEELAGGEWTRKEELCGSKYTIHCQTTGRRRGWHGR